MKSPSTVAENGESVIMPLAKIHATPANGMTTEHQRKHQDQGTQATSSFSFLSFFDFFESAPALHSRTCARCDG